MAYIAIDTQDDTVLSEGAMVYAGPQAGWFEGVAADGASVLVTPDVAAYGATDEYAPELWGIRVVRVKVDENDARRWLSQKDDAQLDSILQGVRSRHAAPALVALDPDERLEAEDMLVAVDYATEIAQWKMSKDAHTAAGVG